VETDPDKLRQLALLDPERAAQLQQFQQVEQRGQQAEEDRFRQERPLIARS